MRFVNGVSDDSPEGQLLLFVEGYVARKEREHTARRTMQGKRETALGGVCPAAGISTVITTIPSPRPAQSTRSRLPSSG